MKRMYFLLISIVLLILVGVSPLYAQDATIDISLSTIPLNPGPSQQVTITAQSYGGDLSQANMVWTYNGKTIASNTGQTQITVSSPAAGGSAVVSVTASGGSFAPTTASLTLRPGSIDVLWEGADSYTPPFYKGRALPSTGGLVRVVAIPAASAPNGLSYSWSQNDSALPNDSGYGKTSIEFKNDPLISTEHIEVGDQNGSYTGDNSVDITPGNATIIGYLNTNGFIDYDNGSTTALNTSGTGAIIHFEPYFFSVADSLAKDLNFSYMDDNGNSLTTSGIKNDFRLSSPTGGGLAQFTVAVGTVVYSLQNLTQAFSVNFN